MLLLLFQQAQAKLIEREPKDPNWIGNIDVTSSDGTDFWASFMTLNNMSEKDPTLKLSIHAVADTTVTIIIEVNGSERGRIQLTQDAAGNVPVGSFTFNSGDVKDVYIPSKDAETTVDRGVHIYSADHKTPFTCYAYAEAGQGMGTVRSSALLLPSHMLGM